MKGAGIMKAITIYQPWANLIAQGEKTIETRSWLTNYRGPLAIHAAKKAPSFCKTLTNIDTRFNHALTGSDEWNPDIWDTLPFGAIVTICTLVDCKKIQITGKTEQILNPQDLSEKELAFGDYTLSRYAWILEDIQHLITPIPTKGKQGLWDWTVPVYDNYLGRGIMV